VKSFRLSDKNKNLIEIFKMVQEDPKNLINSYSEKWGELQRRSEFYYEQRDLYNKDKDSRIFYFLTRTCYNGAIRYNSKGEFNVALHFGRPGMSPDKIEKIVMYYHNLMVGKDIEFRNSLFQDVQPNSKNDVVYLDPPYTNSKALYFGNIDTEILFNWIDNLQCSWFMNMNGNEHEIEIPLKYDVKESLASGKSSFSKMKGSEVEMHEHFYYKKII
jgi:DNA adenine methylase